MICQNDLQIKDGIKVIKLEEVGIQNDANTVKVLQEEEGCKSGHYSVSSKKRVRTLNSLT